MADSTKYTQEDLHTAQEKLRDWQEKFGNYSGNNPNKYRSEIKEACANIRRIETALKSIEVIEMTQAEKINAELDQHYPNARSKSIVTYKGKKYQIRYFPVAKSNSGKTVHEWGHQWCPLK